MYNAANLWNSRYRIRVRSLWTGENSRPMEYKLRSTRILESDDTWPTFSELREPSYPVRWKLPRRQLGSGTGCVLYIGVSKLSCRGCQTFLWAINTKVHDAPNLKATVASTNIDQCRVKLVPEITDQGLLELKHIRPIQLEGAMAANSVVEDYIEPSAVHMDMVPVVFSALGCSRPRYWGFVQSGFMPSKYLGMRATPSHSHA